MVALGVELAQEREQFAGRQAPGQGGGPRVVDEVVALERGHRRDRGGVEAGSQILAVGDAVEAVPAGVDHHGRRGGVTVERDGGGVAVEQQRGLVAADADVDRDRPPLGALAVGGRSGVVEAEAVLAQFECAVDDRGTHERVAGLPDPRIHDAAHRLAARGLDRVPQVVGLGVRVAVQGEVVADALAEALGAEILLEHAQQRATLLVREHVEHALAVGRRADLELDRPGAGERVGLERRAALDAERRPALPVGAVGIARGDLHERGERLVQPDAVPPAHRDQVAEPHVGQFVRDDVGDELALVLGAGGRIDQQQALAERDAPEVLHRAGREVGQGDQVDLRAGVGDAVVVLEPAQAERTHVEAEPGEVALAGDVDEPQRCAVDVDGVRGLEASDDECDQVAAHHHRVGEADDVAAVLGGPVDLGGVGDRRQALGDVERDPEDRLELGFVPARKGAPAVRRLHLGGGDHLLDAVVVDVGAAVEPAQLVVEHAVELDRQDAGAGGDRRGRRDDETFGLRFEPPRRGDPVDLAARDVQLVGIEHEFVGRVVDDQLDADRATERRVGERRAQDQVVAARADAVGKPVGIGVGS